MTFTNEQDNRLLGIIENTSDIELANEWLALVAMQDVYFGEKPAERLLVDLITEVTERVTNECVSRFISMARAKACAAEMENG